MENRSLVTIAEHSKEKILYMLEMAKQFEMNPNRRLLQAVSTEEWYSNHSVKLMT